MRLKTGLHYEIQFVAHTKHYDFHYKTSQWVLYRKITTVYCKKHKKHTRLTHILQNFWNHLKILGARREKFHTGGPINISCHRTQFSRQENLLPEIVSTTGVHKLCV